MTALAAWAVRHRRLVVIGWVVVALLAIAGRRLAGAVFTDNLTIPNSSAQTGLDLLRAHEPKAGGYNGQLVFVVSGGTLANDRATIDQAVTNVGRLAHVLSVSDPLAPGSVAKDGRTAYSAVNFDVNPQSLHQAYVQQVDRAVTPAKRAGVRVLYGGVLGVAAAPKAKDLRSEGIGLTVAVAVLLLAFGSLLAAMIPLVSAVLAVMTGLGLLGILATGVSFGASASTLAAMMGLGVGIDYALFLVTRHRQALFDGSEPGAAIRSTVAGSGRSVAVAATTVVLAMLGLYGSGIAFVGKLGLAAAITVICAALAALTLVPALLRGFGASIDRRSVGKVRAEGGSDDRRLTSYTHAVARHPWRFALGGIVLLAVLAIPTWSMELGHVGAGSQPRSFSERQAYDALADAFGPGVNGRLTVVVALDPHRVSGAGLPPTIARRVEQRLAATAGVAAVSALEPSRDGALLVGRLTPSTGPSDRATQTLLERLEHQVLPDALSGSGARGYITGTVAMTLDFQHTVARRLPLIIAIVVVAAFLLLLVFFRSPVLALKAALMNLLSIGAAYGVLVAVFQWGWGAGLLGLPGKVPIESYVPMIMFAIVFGLSMDYEVFLVSRIREHWLAGDDTRAAVAGGLSRTALVITAAALIMACVFFSFLLSQNVVIKMLALGLGVSVIIDASVIRLVVVPALMFIFGSANWWLPGWLDRVLPRIGLAASSRSPSALSDILRSRMDAHSRRDPAVDDSTADPHQFWQRRYAQREQIWSGNPNAALIDCVSGLIPGTALELGCGEGADTIWLAQHGWRVTAVDIAENAIERGRAAAAARGVSETQIDWIVADLERWRPNGTYDLVSACFLHSPVTLQRVDVLRRAAGAVATGGHLLIVGHLEAPPWASHQHADRGFRAPYQQLAELELDGSEWRAVIAEHRQREAHGPDGQVAVLTDSVLLAERFG